MSPTPSADGSTEGAGPKRAHYIDMAIDFIGGTMGATASVYVGQPLDTVKVKMQTFPTMYRNGLDCFVSTYRKEGIPHGLYAGTVPSLAANISENAILFMAYGLCQKGVAKIVGKKDVNDLNIVQNAVSGSCAAFFAAFTLCPTELIKCKLQAMREMAETGHGSKNAKSTIGPWSLTRQILQAEGIRGMYRGFVPTLMREMPGYFFFFGGYEICRHLLTPEGKTKNDLSPFRTVICGGIGGVSLWTAIFPADVVKSRIQVQTQGAEAPKFIPTLKLIAKEDGVRALYKGLGPTVLRTFPATGALFLAYETTKKVLSDVADGKYSR